MLPQPPSSWCVLESNLILSFNLETNKGTFVASDLKEGGYIVMMQHMYGKILKGKFLEKHYRKDIIISNISPT